MRSLTPLTLTILAAAGCFAGNDDGSGNPANLSTRDGALTAEMRVDGHEHSLVPFGRPSDGAVAVADDGTMAIAQAQVQAIRFFGDDGANAGTFGRAGEGPGEFVSLGRIGWRADSLWVYDVRLGRVTLLTPDRELARTIRVGLAVRPRPGDEARIPPADFSLVAGLRPNDTLIRFVMPFWHDIPDDFAGENFFALSDVEGTIRGVLAHVSSKHQMVVVPSGASAVVPLTNGPIQAVSSDAGRIGTAHVDLDEAEPVLTVQVVEAGGATVFERRFPIETVELPSGVRDSVIDAVALRMRNRELADAVRARVDAITVFPPLEEMIVGRDGTVWIALAERGGTRRHVVLADNGEPIGQVELTGSSRIAEAEEGRIWVIERDEYDVESLVRYRVDW